MKLTCELDACGKVFDRPGTRGPRPRFCSIRCRGRWSYHRPHILRYQKAYNQRPERRRARVVRDGVRYATEEYRTWAREYYRSANFVGVEIPTPYTGHRWLDIARQAAGATDLDSSTQWADDYHDDMGEAVLALLEGRDPRQAVAEYRKAEYVSRRMTVRVGDWGDDPDQQNRWWESVMPQAESAEAEVMAGKTIRYELKARFHRGSNRHTNFSKKGPKRLNQPSRRRMKDAGWEKHGDGRGQEEYAA